MNTIISSRPVMPMREFLLEANLGNPQARMICGFQPAFEANTEQLVNVLQFSQASDQFDLLFVNDKVEVYQVTRIRRSGKIKLHDMKFIAALNGYESWIVVQGLIAFNEGKEPSNQIRHAKKMLIKAMSDMWDVTVKKGA